jgi:molybdopterin converting factor small subunit
MENEEINKQMEELFRLFKKMMEKYPPDSMPGIDKAQAEQLKMMLSNYDSMKVSFSSDMFGFFDEETTKKILAKLISQLREQLGEDAEEVVEKVSLVEQKEKEFEQLPTQDRYIALLDAIDAELKTPNLSMEKIDELLDKRKEIQDFITKQLNA